MVAATSEGARAARLPVLVAIALLGFAALFALAVRVTETHAISPWESAIAMEGMRATAGLPLYDSSHATHLLSCSLQLGRDVISPQDPMIAFRANGTFSPALFFELDTSSVDGEWPSAMPANIADALSRAHYVVQAESYAPVPQSAVALTQFGFRKVEFPQLANTANSVWEK